MFEATGLLFIYVETPLHAGTARGLGAVDLPIQRERTTQYPIVQASSLKGRLRAEAQARGMDRAVWETVFGPAPPGASNGAGAAPSDHAGALSVGDASLLLFPVRSLAGVFAWVTSRDLLARFQRRAELAGTPPDWRLPDAPGRDEAWVSGDDLLAGGQVVLEEFSFQPRQAPDGSVAAIGAWLAAHALPAAAAGQDDVYAYWREVLPRRLCVLPEDACRDFALYATEVQTHVRLDPGSKTVADTGLWTTESLPVDTLLYAPLLATGSRSERKLAASAVLQEVAALGLDRVQLGGDETTGQGIVALRFVLGGAS
ncbi:MAG TPA: type III-B CRISPR module RAMP protein Cmr4 [Chloroflexota bacterium]|nr:type III-B CRISPR module RAMP protein Cmr4 [Chloroflexota bacterium]